MLEEQKTAKRLTVTFVEHDKTPTFSFEGLWTGTDVKVVRNFLWRAYLRNIQGIRRQASEPTKQEVSNERPSHT